jgi:arylsulfatase A-like enzyme
VNIQSPDVPMLIKSPSLTPRRISADYQHVDYAPTVLDAIGLAPAQSYEGRSALRGGIAPRPKSFFSGGHIYRRDAAGNWSSD